MKESINYPKILFQIMGVDFSESMELVFLDKQIHDIEKYNRADIISNWYKSYEDKNLYVPFNLWAINIPNECYPVWLRVFTHFHEHGKKHILLHDFKGGLEYMISGSGCSFSLSPQASMENHNSFRRYDEIDIEAISFKKLEPAIKKVVRDAPQISTRRYSGYEDIVNVINEHIVRCKNPQDVIELFKNLRMVTDTVKSCEEYMYGRMDSSDFHHTTKDENNTRIDNFLE